jgi:hypothetical protein
MSNSVWDLNILIVSLGVATLFLIFASPITLLRTVLSLSVPGR